MQKLLTISLLLFLGVAPALTAQTITATDINGVEYASSTRSILDAYAALPATGGTVELSEDITISTPQTLTEGPLVGGSPTHKPVIIDGAGHTITFSHASGAGFTLTTSNANLRDNVVFKNVVLNCSAAGSNTTALEVLAMTNVLIENVNVTNCRGTGQTGILLDDVQDSKLHAVGFIGNTVGLQAQNFSNNTVCDNCRFNGNVLGWRVVDTSGFAFTGETLTQSNTGPHGGEVLANSQNITNFIYENSWLEFNGDGSAAARHIYFHAADGHVITKVKLTGNTINSLNGGGFAFELDKAGTGIINHVLFGNNQGSSIGSPNLFTGTAYVAASHFVVVNGEGPTHYDVGLAVAGSNGLTFAPVGAAKSFQIYAGFPSQYDGDLVFQDESTGNNILIYESGTSTWDFLSNVNVRGTLEKAAGSFKIDDPLDPANKYLSHSFVESPDMKNIYDGTVVLNKAGQAEVALPDYFEALNKDFRYQLTCIGRSAPVYIAREIENNRFRIAGGTPRLKVSWQVTGTRNDAYARAHRIKVEEEKPSKERGKYLYPELFKSK